MFDKYLICEDSLWNVQGNGDVDGFAFDVRIGYYRGVRLSLVEEIEVVVDGEEVPRERRRFSVDDKTYTFDELATVTDVRWEMGDRATISVERPGGLEPGRHRIEVRELIRITYGQGYARARDEKELEVQA